MAISDNQKIDYLFKKIGFGTSKTDTVFNKLAANESIPSPLLLRGDKVWAEAGSIPAVKPGTTSGVVTLQSVPLECTADITADTYRTWKTGITDWIPTEFGSTYLINVYLHTPGDAAGAVSSGVKLFSTGTGSDDEWFFDYQSGVLNFIGITIPNASSPDVINFSGKSIYITGARYTGLFGVGSSSDISNLQSQIDSILSNTDPATLDSLTEIVTSFQNADIATTSALAAQNTSIRNDLAFSVSEVNDPVSNVSVTNVTGLIFDVDGGFALTDNSDGTVTVTLESTFKTWHVYDTASDVTPTDIIASAVDEISIRAGNNITITPVTTPGSKGITIASDISNLLDLGILDGTNGQILQTDGTGGFTFTDSSITQSSIPTSQEFIGNGSTVAYTLTNAPASEEAIDVYVNDVLQRPSIYSVASTTLTFNEIPGNLDNIYVKYRYPYATMTSPANNSIENQHLNLIYTSSQYTGTTTTQYTIQTGHTVHSVLVIVNGLILNPTEYSVNGATLTISSFTPIVSDVIDFRYLPI